jgi:cytochrome c oxidase cbb3-type subunit I/II
MNATAPVKTTIEYDDRTVRRFLIASIIFGLVGMSAGLLAATQLSFWQMNGKFLEWISFGAIQSEGLQYLTFGRLRPLHTNAAIFAFVGNMMFAGIYYSTQRLCKTRTASDLLSSIHFWGWQLIIVAAAITLPAGLTRGKEYAELIWPINIAVALIWVVFAWNFFWTLKRRNEPSLYVALWFYIATIVTVAMLYIVNHLSIPTSLTHSYPVFAGVQDALVQWWYGHNAVAFFLTTPILGIMYYFMPKACGRPVYSYRLSIIHFWSLVFIYIWAGPHHLLNTSLPRWLQMLGMLFSLMLWAPSWGGMLNGLLTLRGAWDKLRTDPVIKFFVAAITFYGMATFEGPLLSIRAVNALSHNTDWTIGHVHAGTLGWNGFMAAGMFYWMVPKLWGRPLRSTAAANMHFWIGLTGILLYVSAMWASGITQGLQLNELNADGTRPKYEFVETLRNIKPLMLARTFGGGLYLLGYIIMIWNLFATIRSGAPVSSSVEVYVEPKKHDRMSWKDVFINDPIIYTVLGVLLCCLWFFLPNYANVGALAGGLALVIKAVTVFRNAGKAWGFWYDRLIENWLPFTVLTLIAVAFGGLLQIIPTVMVNRGENITGRLQTLYTPLELSGRDIYIKEGCYNCHTQMVRQLVPDVIRYGTSGVKDDYSHIGESIYDHPFQWGSKRTGPDLAREGSKRDLLWQVLHLRDPRSMDETSTMPNYPWLFDQKFDIDALPKKIAVQRTLGVPYEPMTADVIKDKARKQALEIHEILKGQQTWVEPDREIIALVAYLKKLGTWSEVKPDTDPALPPVPAPGGGFTPGDPDHFRVVPAATTLNH